MQQELVKSNTLKYLEVRCILFVYVGWSTSVVFSGHTHLYFLGKEIIKYALLMA